MKTLKLTGIQTRIVEAALQPEARVIAICGRRSGKTTAAIALTLHHLFQQKHRILYVAPTYKQAKDIIWNEILDFIDDQLIINRNAQELEIRLTTGSQLLVRSGEAVNSVVGIFADLLVLDEAALMEKRVFDLLLPTLLTRRGSLLITTTPRGMSNWIYHLWISAKNDPRWTTIHVSTFNAGLIPQTAIDEINQMYERGEIDHHTYANEYLAEFAARDIRVYKDFTDDNLTDPIQLENTRPLWIGMDFNVSPMTIVYGQKHKDFFYVHDVAEFHNSNTIEVIDWIKSNFPDYRIAICPDATAGRRTTNSFSTDLQLLSNAGFHIRYHKSENGKPMNPPIMTRIAHVNEQFRKNTLRINRNAKKLIEVLEQMYLDEKTNMPIKDGKYDHISDALGYLVWQTITPRYINTPRTTIHNPWINTTR